MSTPSDGIAQPGSAPVTGGEAASASRLQRPILKKVALVGVALAAGFATYAMFVPSPRVPMGVLTATEDEREATGYRQEGEVSGGAAASATATVIQSKRNVAATTSSSHSKGARPFDRTLAVLNLDDDLLMKRVGLALFEKLRDAGRFEQIRYFPADERPAFGQPLPDVFVTLQKSSWEEGGVPGRRTFKGKLVVTAGNQYQRSNPSYNSTFAPPQVRFRRRAEVDYTATQTGIETSGARYQDVSGELAKEIAGQLTTMLDDLASDYGTAAELPGQFYPDYIEPPVFDFLAELDAEKLVDGPQFMASTVAVWRIAGDRDAEDIVDVVRRSLAADSWTISEESEPAQSLRATDGVQVVEVFREDDGFGVSDEDASPPPPLFVVYTRGMSEVEVHAAVRQMLENGREEQALVMFQRAWHQHEELVEQYFSKRHPTSPESWLQLAHLRKKAQPEAAREALLRANALQRIVRHDAPDASMKELADELGIGELPQQVTHEMIQTLGLGELSEPGEIEVTVREDEPAAVWLGDTDSVQTWLLLTPLHRRGKLPKRTLKVQTLQLLTPRASGLSEHIGGDLTNPDLPVYTEKGHVTTRDLLEIFSARGDDERTYRLTLRRASR